MKAKYKDIKCKTVKVNQKLSTYNLKTNVNGYKKDKVIIAALTSLLIIQLSLIIVVIHFWKIETDKLDNGSTIMTEFLIPCDDLSLSLDEDAETFDGKKNKYKHFVDADGTSLCLFNNLTEIVVKKTERESRIRLAEGITFKSYQSCGNPALAPSSGYMTAFLSQLSTKQPEQKGKEQTQQVNWGLNNSFAGIGVEFNKGRIQVTYNNIYFVYAIISFSNTIGKGDCGSCIFTVSIFKTNVMYADSYESRELQERETLCNKTTGISTMHLGSHIYLDKGDVVYVKVSDVSILDVDSVGNGFGLFPLP